MSIVTSKLMTGANQFTLDFQTIGNLLKRGQSRIGLPAQNSTQGGLGQADNVGELFMACKSCVSDGSINAVCQSWFRHLRTVERSMEIEFFTRNINKCIVLFMATACITTVPDTEGVSYYKFWQESP